MCFHHVSDKLWDSIQFGNVELTPLYLILPMLGHQLVELVLSPACSNDKGSILDYFLCQGFLLVSLSIKTQRKTNTVLLTPMPDVAPKTITLLYLNGIFYLSNVASEK